MKIRAFILGFGLIAAALSSCNEDLNLVGGSIQPEGDRVNVSVDTFMMNISTVKIDSVYARSENSLLGELYDPVFGNIKSDFICQFYCKEGFEFMFTPIDGKIDSVNLFMHYSSSIGDTLTPMRADVYPVIKTLPKHFYTHIDPEQYCDMTSPLAGKAYTAYDLTISDSIRKITDSNDENYYTPHINIKLPIEFGQKIYDETINNPASFANQQAFNDFLPGMYVTTTFGTGNILDIYHMRIEVSYRYERTEEGSDGQDSISVQNFREYFLVTNEVAQLIHMKNSGLEDLLVPNNEYAYVRTPAGVFTKLVVPAADIFQKVGDRAINNFPLSLKGMPSQGSGFTWSHPANLLIMPEDSLRNFFENNRKPDNSTIFEATYTPSTFLYNFGNISKLLQVHRNNSPGEDLRLLVVPIENVRVTDEYNQSYTVMQNNYLKPSGVALRKDGEFAKVQVITSKYE